MRRAALVLAVLGVWMGTCTLAEADDARPASLTLRERAPNEFDVRWQTPLRGTATLRMAPRLPDGVVPVDGSYERRVTGDALVETWRVVVEGGLEGRHLAVEGLALSTRGAVVEVHLRSGAVHRAVLSGARPGFDVPEPAPVDRPGTIEQMPGWLTAGFLGGLGLSHLVFALLLVLAGGARTWGFALGAFFVADVAGGLLPSTGISPDLAHGLLALAGVIAAREAVLEQHRRLLVVALLAGLVHGLSLDSPASAIEMIALAVGTDAAHLAVGGAALLGRALAPSGAVRVVAMAGGVLGIAVAIVFALAQSAAASPPRSVPISPMAFVGGSDTPLAPRTPSPVFGRLTALEIYLDVAVFETRVELLGRVADLDRWLGLDLGDADVISVDDQTALLDRIERGLAERLPVQLNARPAAPDDASLGFAVQDEAGVYFRSEPTDEIRSEAVVGAVFALYTPQIPETVSVQVRDLPAAFGVVRARTIDPEVSRDVPFDEPSIAWTNELESDPLPPIETVAVRTVAPALPILSILLLIAGVLTTVIVARRRRPYLAAVALRSALVLALASAPLWTVEIEALAATPAPTDVEARAITRTLLENVYRAFNQKQERAVYDRLERSLVGDQLEQAYLQNRQTLEIAKVGGARAHVDIVELRSLDGVVPRDGGGFEAEATWTIAGSVTHFGHRHLRQNRYEARLVIAPTGDAWKITGFELRATERTR